MGGSLTSSDISIEPGCLPDPPIGQYNAPTPLLDEHDEEEEEFNVWLGSLTAPDDQQTVTYAEPNQQVVPTLSSVEQRDWMSPMPRLVTSEQPVVLSTTMTTSQVPTAVIQDPITEAIRQSTILMENTIREGHSTILSAINANHKDMLNVLKEIREALQKKKQIPKLKTLTVSYFIYCVNVVLQRH
ncbi:hypothetical protein DPMN_033478 [Dreissena polymorpha]|uniref:Uncharacterized protein n=1 Tax=Dreissena polymorpha TaxID=45954 RepID=A0A9D4M8G6_DREPO|nr:hypothetical protein DPMN_033478 [Dreissena polymorpha]